MGFEDNEVWFPDALPRYVEAFGERFEAGYTGPSDHYRVTATLAVGNGLTVFYAHVEDRDEHLLLPLGDEESDPEEVDRLETVVQAFAGPNAATVAEAFRTHLHANYDRVERVPGSVHVLRCQYASALGGQPTMMTQAYANPASESLSVGYTPKHTDDPEALEACIAKNVPTKSVEAYVDRLVYGLNTELREERLTQNLVEGLDRETLETLGFRYQTTKHVPSDLHPDHGGREAELWQMPAGKARWVDGSTGFVRIWRLPDDTGLIDPVSLEGPHDDEVAATKSQLTA